MGVAGHCVGVPRLAARGTVVVFDRRGTGLSDKVSGERLPALDAKMDDIRAVMDAVGFDRAVLYGQEDGAAPCLLFAATYPERTQAVITAGPRRTDFSRRTGRGRGRTSSGTTRSGGSINCGARARMPLA